MAVLRVRDGFAVNVGNVLRVYSVGDLIDADDPVATPQRRELFLEPVEATVARTSPTVEAATAAPGERRTRTSPQRSTQPKEST